MNHGHHFCPHCGKPLPADAAFCASCGNKLPNAVPQQGASAAPTIPAVSAPSAATGSAKVKTGTTGLIIGIILGLFLPIITRIIALILHGNYRKSGNLSDAKGLKIGFLATFLVACLLPLLAAIIVPNFVRARAEGHYTACKSNLKNIGTACEMYCCDHEGRYPESLAELTTGENGSYLKLIPTCPAGSGAYGYKKATGPDLFVVYCAGHHHEALDIPENRPAYDSVTGLIEDNTASGTGLMP
ncbi:MAG: zinc ribbon domain-containing protein [bacterium]|nr:zinc ribbon domain-containing protein [bacterium]